jgi:excinuclease ABC subunit A
LLGLLVGEGSTVVVTGHNPDMIKLVDLIIDIGPKGGNAGGEIVAFGTPDLVVAVPASYTVQFLKEILKGKI